MQKLNNIKIMKKELVIKDLNGIKWALFMVLFIIIRLILLPLLLAVLVSKIVYRISHIITMAWSWLSNKQGNKVLNWWKLLN